MWKLLLETDTGERVTTVLSGDVYVIGRRAGSAIRLTEQNVSREHARLARAGRTWMVEDMKSYNGLYVNGARVVGSEPLVNGDVVQIGDYRLFLEQEATPVPAAAPMSARAQLPNRLVMLTGPSPGHEYALVGERILVGRSSSCALTLPHDSVSRAHCELVPLAQSRFEVVDLRSANGIRVNGQELRRAILDSGDLLEVGDVRLRCAAAGELYTPAKSELKLLRTGERPFSIHRLLPYVLFVVVAAIGVLVVWKLTRS